MLSTYQPSKAIVWVHARACSSFSRCLPCASTFDMAGFCWYIAMAELRISISVRYLNRQMYECTHLPPTPKTFRRILGENAIRQKGHPVYWWTKFDVMKYIVFSRNTCMYILNIARVAMANGKQQAANSKQALTYLEIWNDPQGNGGHVQWIGYKINDIPHIVDIFVQSNVPQLFHLTPDEPWLKEREYDMVHGAFTYTNLPLTQANISHSTADGVAPRFVGASFSSLCSGSTNSQPLTTDSMRCEASINKTVSVTNDVRTVFYARATFTQRENNAHNIKEN